jgi:hypothetical protein
MEERMRLGSRLLVVLVAAMLAVPAVVAAQEFDPLIGTWVLNVSKSQWGTATPPRSQIRTFDYTNDGLIICTWRNVSAKGEHGFVHWFTKLDGQHRPEYSRGRARDSFSSISVKKTGDYTFEVEGKRLKDNWVTFTGTGELSKDGKTLTWRVSDRRDKNDSVRVYEKEAPPAS